MDIGGVLDPAVNQAARQKSGDAVSVAVLKKALDIESESAAAIINTVASASAEVPTDKLPPHLGRSINVTA